MKSAYPGAFEKVTDGREKTVLGDVVGLTQFGVNLTRLKPGAASAQRHWHETEDEFVYILEGEATLIENGGETVLKAGDCAGFKANDPQRPLPGQQSATRRGLSRSRHPRGSGSLPLSRRRPCRREERERRALLGQIDRTGLMPKIDIAKAEVDRSTPLSGAAGRSIERPREMQARRRGRTDAVRRQHRDAAARRLVVAAPLARQRGRIHLRARRRDRAGRGRRRDRCSSPATPRASRPIRGNGHCLINRGSRTARYLEVGTRLRRTTVTYSDVDLRLERDGPNRRYLHKSGEPY